MQNQGILELGVVLYIITGIMVGFIGRWYMLRGDIRQYPSHPDGYLIHLTTGFIASAIGAVAYPALVTKEYTAVTFLVLAIQQFRDIRKMEKESLQDIEKDAYFPRGSSYIDGIAKTFEARNYISMIASFATTFAILTLKVYITNKFILITTGAILGFITIYLLKRFTKGETMKDIITLEETPLSFNDIGNLYVGDTYIMNIGLLENRERILKKGIGIILKPKGEKEKVILNYKGQRKAILHECSRLLGIEKYVVTKRNFDTGEVILMMVPIIKDISRLIEIIESVPILETNKRLISKG